MALATELMRWIDAQGSDVLQNLTEHFASDNPLDDDIFGYSLSVEMLDRFMKDCHKTHGSVQNAVKKNMGCVQQQGCLQNAHPQRS